MQLSNLATSISASVTLALNEEAGKLRSRGEPVIHMGGGQPKNPAPLNGILGAAAKLNDGKIKYAPIDGTKSLKQAIIRYTEENYGRLVSPDNIVVSTGAKQALYNVLMALLDPQDEVILLAPYWVSYPEMVKMLYGTPVIVTPEDGTFQPTIAEVEEAISSYTKAIIVNSPNNPSGVVYTDEFIAQLVELCESRGIYMINDDIYHKLVETGVNPPPAYKYTNQDIESTHVITINGISKLYGMTGFRIGWSITNKPMAEVVANIQGQITSCASAVSQAAAEGALTGVQSTVESLRLQIENNRRVMVNELATFTGVKLDRPRGTFYCLPDFSAYNPSSVALARFLLEKALVVCIPGAPFGMEGHLRMSYTDTPKEITEGIKRLKWALDPEAPNEIYIGDRKLIRDWL